MKLEMIADLRLQQFRSYLDKSFELKDGVNIVVGPNASGKTNLLEAILVAARGSSYRAKDQDLIMFGKPWAKVAVRTADDDRVTHIEAVGGADKKHYRIKGQTLWRLSLQKKLPVVIFEPEHLQMLSGPPDLRRQFIDDLLEQISTGFPLLRRQYRRALTQRNTLLKHPQSNAAEQLFAWNIRLSELGAAIASQRIQLINDMDEQAEEVYNRLAHTKAKVDFAYSSDVSIENYGSDLLHKLQASAAVDFERGFTAHGPHRDDLQILLNGRPAQTTASRGEIRTMLLVCKMLEAKLLELAHQQRPILLLDDVFSELDTTRRQALTKFIKPYQSFITTTDADVVAKHLTNSANIIMLK